MRELLPTPLLLTYTGIPAVGKTSSIEASIDVLQKAGIEVFQMIDYPKLKKWAQDNRGREHLVHWPTGSALDSDDFMLQLEAYPEASYVVASALAIEIAELVSPDTAFLVEAARGAGSPRDSYGDHFFAPLAAELAELVNLANIELIIPNQEKLMKRAVDRYENSNHQAPPPEVTARYLSRKGQQAESSLSFAANSGFHVLFNEQIDNSDQQNKGMQQVKGLVENIILSRK
jgi:hypothetical protein